MFYCWKFHHLRPKDYYDMSYGEKTVIRAFYFQEMEERKEQAEAMAEAGMCPAMAFI